MKKIELYHLPGACSRVTITALEHVGLTFEDEIVDLSTGQQHSPEFRAINPRGKIPALVVDGKLLSENAAIIFWLNERFPEAGLLPEMGSPWERAKVLSDLFWISSGWHPAVRANMMPIRLTTGDPEPVRQKGRELVKPYFEQLDAKLRKQDWWYESAWSILDTYAYWCYTTAEEGGYDLSGLHALNEHRRRVEAHPAFQKAIHREEVARVRLSGG